VYGNAKGLPTASYMADPAPMIGPGLFFTLSPGPCFRGPPGVEKNSLKKDSRGSNFLEGEEGGLRRGEAVVYIFSREEGRFRA